MGKSPWFYVTIFVSLIALIAVIGLIAIAGYLTVTFVLNDFNPSTELANVDNELKSLIEANGVTPLDLGPIPDPAKVALGEALFFDKEINN